MLIATRALLGIAGATLAPSTLSLIGNMFADARQRTFAIGVWITSFSAGAAIGPILGRILLEVAEAARGTLGGAAALAGHLSGQQGAALLDTARDAFGQAFGLTAAVGAAVLIATATVSAVLLGRSGESGSERQAAAVPAGCASDSAG